MLKIYKLTNEDGLNYIGKTKCKYLSSRLAVHKSQAKTNRKINKCSSSILFVSKVKIELLEETTDPTRELYFINKISCVNKNKPTISYKETKKNWCNKNPQYHNDYYHKNKDKINEKIKCECGKFFCKSSKSHHIQTKFHKENICIVI
tara:strand:- start:30 stop:473 length:444 start_codon:yes stop_codon:yes gene_type:complete